MGMSKADHLTAGATILGLGVLAALAVAGADALDPAAGAAPTPSSASPQPSRSAPAPVSGYDLSLPTHEPSGSSDPDLLQRLVAQRAWDESSSRDKQLNCRDYRILGPTWYGGVLRRAGQSESEVDAMLAVVRRECT